MERIGYIRIGARKLHPHWN